MNKTLLAVSTAALLAGSTAIWAQGLPASGGNAPTPAEHAQHQSAKPDEGNTGPGDIRSDQTRSQGPRDNEMRPDNDRNGPIQRTQLQSQDRDQMQGDRDDRMQGDRDRLQGGQMLRGGDVRGEGTHHLTVQERTNLRDTVLLRGPRVSHVNFRIGVGARVPRAVHLVAVPQPIVAIYPEWSGDLFFSYGDEVVVVAPDNMQIVGVLPL